MQTKKLNPIFSVSRLQKICVDKKAALMSALPTHCKLSTEAVSVSDIVIGEGFFGRVKVVHMNSLDLQCVVKEGKEKLYFQPVFEARVLQELRGSDFFPFVFCVCDNRLVLELICSDSNYCNCQHYCKFTKKVAKLLV